MYSLAQAAFAAGLPTETVLTWLDRRVVRLRSNDVEASGSGSRRRYSRQRVLQLAIVGELGAIGIRHTLAAQFALEFSDRATVDRQPASLFDEGDTLLVIADDQARVINLRPTAPWSDLATDQFGVRAIVATIVDLRQLVSRVDQRLAEIPRTIEHKGSPK